MRIGLALLTLTALLATEPLTAGAHGLQHYVAQWQARCTPWHGPYAHPEYSAPVALVVPPTATLHTNWGWGVGNTRISRTNHQFGRAYPGVSPSATPIRPAPPWPSDTWQMGVYPVRGPW